MVDLGHRYGCGGAIDAPGAELSIRVATRSDLARRWHDLMGVNAGSIAEGAASIENVGWELFRLLLDVASRRRSTWPSSTSCTLRRCCSTRRR